MAQQIREQRIGAEFFGQSKGINGVPGRLFDLPAFHCGMAVHKDFGMVRAIWQLLKDIGLNHIGG